MSPHLRSLKSLLTLCWILGGSATFGSHFGSGFGNKFETHRVDSHAPIGVMGDHVHLGGEFMLSYRYMFMEMDGLRDGTDTLTPAQVLTQFPVTPVRMTMQMHMVGLMYAPTDRLTLMAMLPYRILEMDHVTGMGGFFTTESEGIGDLKLSGIYKLTEFDGGQLLLNFGFSAPTGSIDEMDATPAAPSGTILPYPMQQGSGTFDAMPGITYNGQSAAWSWGGQLMGTFRLGENDRDYQLGNRYEGTVWLARAVSEWLSFSARTRYQYQGNIDGADPALNPMMVPTADPDLRAFSRLDMLFGVNFLAPKSLGVFSGHRLAVEGGLPVYQRLDGPQLEIDYLITVGWQKAF
ncbi:MAG: transporter [Opitutales bacterium]